MSAAERLFPVLYMEVNAIGLLILLIVLFSQHHTGLGSPESRFFRRVVFACIGMLVLDTAMWLLDGRAFEGARALLYGVTLAYYVCTPLPAYFWMHYCDFYIFADEDRLRARRGVHLLPFAANAALCASSLWTGAVFRVDAANVYHRGPWFALHGVFALSYLVWALVTVWRRPAERIPRSRRVYMTLFMLPPAVGVAVQWSIYGITLLWVMSAVSVLFVYVNVQNQQIFTDPLTGLNNRRRFVQYLELRAAPPAGQRLYALMIDMDRFKRINDTRGHAEGDRALVRMAGALKRVCAAHNDFLARIGGDEFVLVCQRADEDGVRETVRELRAYVEELNRNRGERSPLAFSVGWAEFGRGALTTADAVLVAADAHMYRVKRAHGKACEGAQEASAAP